MEEVLENIAEVFAGGKRKLSGLHFVEDGYPAYGAGGLNGYLPEYEFDKTAIILSANGARCGKCFFVEGKWISLANTQVILPDTKKVNPKFLFYQLNDEDSWHKGGTAQPFIKPSDVKSRKIFCPDLKTQQKITYTLEQADAARQKRKQALALTEQFLQSAFLEMFGDPVRNEKGWEKVRVSELGKVQTGNTPSRKIAEYFGDYIEWIKTDNILVNKMHPTIAKEKLSEIGLKVGRCVDKNSILVTCIAGSPATIGNVALTNRKVAFNQQINSVTPTKDIDPIFLYCLFRINKPQIQKSTTLGMKRIITKSKFEDLKMIKPPLPLQQEFAALVERVEQLRHKQRESEKELENLFGSLMERWFG